MAVTDQELGDIEQRAGRQNADLRTLQNDARTLIAELRRMRDDESKRNTPDGERKHIATRARQLGWTAPEGWKDDDKAADATSSKDTAQTSTTRMTSGGPETKQNAPGTEPGPSSSDSNNRTK